MLFEHREFVADLVSGGGLGFAELEGGEGAAEMFEELANGVETVVEAGGSGGDVAPAGRVVGEENQVMFHVELRPSVGGVHHGRVDPATS